jgi:SsrA-binding protein
MAKKKNKNPSSILNIKKVGFEYEIIESFKAGVMLEGWMLKSIRARKISASDSVYVQIMNGEAFISGVNITSMLETNSFKSINEQPLIKLLLNKKEINRMIIGSKEKGYTLVLQNIFWDKHLVKANVAIAKGKNLHDKRRTIKDRDSKRDADRAIKKYS